MKLYQMRDDISVFKGYERKTDPFSPVLKTPIPRILMKISLHIGSPSKPFYFLYLDIKSSFQKIKMSSDTKAALNFRLFSISRSCFVSTGSIF